MVIIHDGQLDGKIKQHNRRKTSNNKEEKDPPETDPPETAASHGKKYLKKNNNNIFKHINKAGEEFKDAVFAYMADFIHMIRHMIRQKLCWLWSRLLDNTTIKMHSNCLLSGPKVNWEM